MSRLNRVIIVVVLVCAIGAVLVMKRRKPQQEPDPAQVIAAETSDVAAPGRKPEATEALPRLVDLGAGKCIPCKMMAPILDELERSYAGVFDVEFIDIRETPDASEIYGVRLIPTQVFYDATGKELFRHEGFFSKEDILATWKEYGIIATAEL